MALEIALRACNPREGDEVIIRALKILCKEIEITMAKCGRPTVAEIDSTVVVKAPRLQGVYGSKIRFAESG